MRSLGLVSFHMVAVTLVWSSPAVAGSCRDPWITQAIKEVTGREPNGSGESGECTYTQYRNGSWNNYAELKAAVQAKFQNSSAASYAFGQPQQFAPATQIKARVDQVQTRDMGGGKIQFLYNNKWYWLVGNDGASLIGNDSAGAVPTNGGGFISTNGGNILSNANAALKARGY